MSQKIKVLVISGGPSAEHEISLKTGGVIAQTLDQEKYEVQKVIIARSGEWLFYTNDQSESLPLGIALERIRAQHMDVAFIALHGTFGEDGAIQALLESIGLRYTGSGILASALAMNKVKSNEIFLAHGLNVPEFLSVSSSEWEKNPREITKNIIEIIRLPLVIKPSGNGSSVGISIINHEGDIISGIEKALRYDSAAIIQKYIAGDEVTCAVIENGGGKTIALPPTQIIPKASFFDYEAKYTVGGSEEITPPRLPQNIIKNIQDIALKAHTILGCSGMSRTDMIIRDETVHILETNTIPGMTETSLLPQAARAADIPFWQILDWIIASGLKKD